MCRLSIAIDQSVHTLAPIFDLIERSAFCLRSIRVAPVARSSLADVYLSLAGGERRDLDALVREIANLPAVRATSPVYPAVLITGNWCCRRNGGAMAPEGRAKQGAR